MSQRRGSGLYPADTAPDHTRGRRPVSSSIHVLDKPVTATAETVHNAQIVVAGRAYQQDWPMSELLQVLDSLGIRPTDRGGSS